MQEIQTIRFDGDSLQTVRDEDGRVWVVVRRVCEVLGLDRSGQQQRLQDPSRAPWASGGMMPLVAEDGKNRELFCLDLDSLPMWLATIEVGRVRLEAREKLIHYQRECARVLRDHFFGARTSLDAVWTAIAELRDGHRQLVDGQRQLAQAVQTMAAAIGNLDRQVSWLTHQISTGGVIAPSKHREMRLQVRSIGALEVAQGRHKNKRAATADLYREMGEATAWGGKAKPWIELPTALIPAAFAVLRRRRKDAEAALCIRAKQLRLVVNNPDNQQGTA